ncbi:hemicentin-1-like [Adelges cooleyi]|uniref:hemicentin-1-like n=1 Tax=Adelges cooleyi TaxID=133065 RepID=UPI0021802985|nr:hemicentin-1-like [Adelges cooleyi]
MVVHRLTSLIWLLAVIWSCFCITLTKSVTRETHNIKQIESIVGEKAVLPCRVQDGKTNITDWPVLIIWYKGEDVPIYSVDHRERSTSKHWASKSMIDRVYYTISKGWATLTIESVQPSDGGQYRCREDFKYSPTRNNYILLNIIVPPNRLEIVNADNRIVWNSTMPPILENDPLEITCIAYDGHPLPRVMWNIRGDNEDTAYGTRIGDTAVANTLRIAQVRRENLGKTLICEASNIANAVQLSTSVVINVYLKPLTVAITGAEQPLTSGEYNSLDCVSYGSRPPANITWYHDGRAINFETKRIKVIENSNMTWSSLKILPDDNDDQSVISCQASNTYFPAHTLHHQITLGVQHPPRLQINLGRNLNASNIKEGSDVYFECVVKASPAITKLEWNHNDTNVGPYGSRKIIYSNQTLVLQSITRQGSGRYRCLASNARGKTVSDVYVLDVKYEPACNSDQQHVYGAHRGETIHIKCDVNSNPAATSFRWAFNSSVSGLTRVTTIDKGSPTIKFRVINFGTMLCWATNTLATQSHPCMFHVVPAERPGPPRTCTPMNVTSTRFTVLCEPGYGGGLPQQLICTVAVAGRSDHKLNSYQSQTGQTSVQVTGLRPSTQYVVTIHSSNAKGPSTRYIQVYVETAPNPKDPRVAGDSTSTVTRFSNAAYVGIVLLSCCFVGACAMAVVFAKRLTTGQSVFQQRSTTVRSRDGEEIRFSGAKDSADRRPVVSKNENGLLSRLTVQLKSQDLQPNDSCQEPTLELTARPVTSLQPTNNSKSFYIGSRVTDNKDVRSYGPMINGVNQQKLCDSFVVYPNHRSVPVQDMVYTRTTKPYTEIESIV